MKKASLGWDVIGKLILLVIIMLILLTIVGLLTGKTHLLLDKIKDLFTFQM